MGRPKKDRRFKLRYAVLGEGITEQWYLKHLKDTKGYKFAIRPSLFADITIEKAEDIIDELLSGGCNHITFLTDYDTIVAQGKKDVFDKLVEKYKACDEVLICDSMPSIEIWFLLHFKYTSQEFISYEQLERVLKKSIPDYQKKQKYLEKINWFNALIANGGFDKAGTNASKLLKQKNKGNVGEHFPFTKMHLAIEKFESQK